DEGSAHGSHIKIPTHYELIVVIQDVVKLAAELQAETLSQLKVLVEVHIKVPEARPKELVTTHIRGAIGSICTAYVVQTSAIWNSKSDTTVVDRFAFVGHISACRLGGRKRDVVENVCPTGNRNRASRARD